MNLGFIFILIQNAAASIVTTTKKAQHITAVVTTLATAVSHRINVKDVLLLVHKSLIGWGPGYLTDLLTQYEPCRPLRSAASGLLAIPRVKAKHAEAAFSLYAAQMWNKLPVELTSNPAYLLTTTSNQFYFQSDLFVSCFYCFNTFCSVCFCCFIWLFDFMCICLLVFASVFCKLGCLCLAFIQSLADVTCFQIPFTICSTCNYES